MDSPARRPAIQTGKFTCGRRTSAPCPMNSGTSSNIPWAFRKRQNLCTTWKQGESVFSGPTLYGISGNTSQTSLLSEFAGRKRKYNFSDSRHRIPLLIFSNWMRTVGTSRWRPVRKVPDTKQQKGFRLRPELHSKKGGQHCADEHQYGRHKGI